MYVYVIHIHADTQAHIHICHWQGYQEIHPLNIDSVILVMILRRKMRLLILTVIRLNAKPSIGCRPAEVQTYENRKFVLVRYFYVFLGVYFPTHLVFVFFTYVDSPAVRLTKE